MVIGKAGGQNALWILALLSSSISDNQERLKRKPTLKNQDEVAMSGMAGSMTAHISSILSHSSDEPWV